MLEYCDKIDFKINQSDYFHLEITQRVEKIQFTWLYTENEILESNWEGISSFVDNNIE